MSYEVSTGISGAASGAQAGAAVGGPIGAAIGGGVGLVSGFFGGDEEEGVPDETIRENEELLGMLRDRFQAARNRSPTETTLFEAGTTAQQERQERQADRDASQAAARGLTGSQFELAQDASRSQQAASSQRDLLVQSDRVQREEERQALQSMLQQRANLNNLQVEQSTRQARQNQRQNQMASQAVSGFAQSMLGREGGPPLEDELNSFFGGSGGSTADGGFFDTGQRFGINSYA